MPDIKADPSLARHVRTVEEIDALNGPKHFQIFVPVTVYRSVRVNARDLKTACLKAVKHHDIAHIKEPLRLGETIGLAKRWSDFRALAMDKVLNALWSGWRNPPTDWKPNDPTDKDVEAIYVESVSHFQIPDEVWKEPTP